MYNFDKETYTAAHNQIFTAYDKKYKDRITPLFEDGVVCPDKYQGIVFLLKEAYDRTCVELHHSLNDDLLKRKPWGMWHHVAEWSYGLVHTSKDRIAAFKDLSSQEKRDAIDTIAVINVKKHDGQPKSVDADVLSHAINNATYLLQEIEAAQPRIIVCGGTMKYLDKILGITHKKRCDNWYYWLDIGNLKHVLVLDYCHPAFRSYSLLYYYGITNIYQQALIRKNEHTDKQ